jgi:NACalpha-BTF3-like transcription factor
MSTKANIFLFDMESDYHSESDSDYVPSEEESDDDEYESDQDESDDEDSDDESDDEDSEYEYESDDDDSEYEYETDTYEDMEEIEHELDSLEVYQRSMVRMDRLTRSQSAIELVMHETKVSRSKAIKALQKNNGNIINSIMYLLM